MIRRYAHEEKPFIHPDGRVLRVGKHPARFDPRTPQFHRYLAESMPPAPSTMDWYKGVTNWGMMENDTLGCCTISSKGHDIQVCSLNTFGEATITDQQVIEYYSKWDGYVPGDPSTDNGGEILTVLQDWQKQTLAGRILLAYTSINPADTQNILKAIQLLGTVDIGLQLPITAQSQVGNTWDVVGNPSTDPNSQPGSWGGHDVNCGKYDFTVANGLFYVITWGAIQAMTLSFLRAYSDELYGLLLQAWLWGKTTGIAPSGFDLAQLIADGKQLAA
jgi:hypothetical protein